MKFCLSVLVLSMALLSSCEKNSTEPEKPVKGWDYFPVDQNNTWIYKVDSVVYSEFQKGQIDTFSYWIKERIVEDFASDSTLVFMKIERQISHDSLVWFFDRNFSIKRNTTYAIRTDDNITEIKMSYPVSLFKSWDANQFNNTGKKNYTYDAVYRPYSVRGIQYDSTISILQEKVQNFIQSKLVREVYAKNKGMVYKEYTDLNLDIVTDPITQTKDTTVDGLRLTYKLVSFVR